MSAHSPKKRGYTPKKKRPKGGRNPLADERIVQVGVKMPVSVEQAFIEKVAELRAKGYKTTKSHLLRTLAVYMLPYAEDALNEIEGKNAIGNDSKGEAQA